MDVICHPSEALDLIVDVGVGTIDCSLITLRPLNLSCLCVALALLVT